MQPLRPLKFGALVLDAPFFQASLSGYSDWAMRAMARRFGAPLTFAGVMLAKMIEHPRALRKPCFVARDDEHPIGAQLMGGCPETMARAAKALQGIGYDMIDLNFACPAPKVLRRQRGGYLLREPHRVLEIFRRVRDAVTCPVTMKLRMAYDSQPEHADALWHICDGAVTAGVDGLMLHGRTTLQRFKGRADWSVLAELKRRHPHCSIVGSGDLFTAEDIRDRMAETGIDGVVVARGAIGNPWIFAEARALLAGAPRPTAPTVAEQGAVAREHYARIVQLYHGKKTVAYFRKFAARYARRHPERKAVTLALMAAGNDAELAAAIDRWYGPARADDEILFCQPAR